jgi:hypothetical protein
MKKTGGCLPASANCNKLKFRQLESDEYEVDQDRWRQRPKRRVAVHDYPGAKPETGQVIAERHRMIRTQLNLLSNRKRTTGSCSVNNTETGKQHKLGKKHRIATLDRPALSSPEVTLKDY